MDYSLEDCLPAIYIENADNQFNLHWQADMNYEASLILNEHRDYIEGFLDGCYKLLSQNYPLPTKAWGHSSGHVHGIPKEVAETLEQLLTELLHGLVTARYQNLQVMREPHPSE